MTPPTRPLPAADRDSRPWWDALGRHQLLVQRCECGHLRWPFRVLCNRCGSLRFEEHEVSGRAEVVSWIVNHHRFSAAFPARYVVVAARLAEQDDIVIPGSYEGPDDGVGLWIGAPVVATFTDVVDDDGHAIGLLNWKLDEGDRGDEPA